MRLDIITLFPEIFSGFVSESILAKAIAKHQIEVHLHNPRLWTQDKHGRVDDRPYGGGPGMVLAPQPIIDCVQSVQQLTTNPGRLILLSPSGRRLDQPYAERLAIDTRLVLICGRYEGFDQRIIDILKPEELSIGDYVLNGGEVAAMVLVETVMRLLPGVLGDENSAKQDSFSYENRILEFPQYTRPFDFRGATVPPVLISGDHAAIEAWRREQSRSRTADRRSELLPEDPT